MKTKGKIYRPCAVCGDRATGYHYKVELQMKVYTLQTIQ